MTVITSLDDPRIAPYRSLRDISTRNAVEKLFVVENSKVIRRLLTSDCEIRSFFATKHYYEEFAPLLDARSLTPAERLIADDALMNTIVGYNLHEGVMALAVVPDMPYFSEHFRTIELPAVCLCGVADAENVGAIVRNCAAFGVRSLIIDSATCSPYLRRAVRVSLGGIFALRVYRTTDLVSALEEMKHSRPLSRSIALETSIQAHSLATFPFSDESVLIFGSEASGLPSNLLSVCDAVVEIPMTPLAAYDAVNSLNVAASTAIALYHWRNCVKT
jgi:tRNA G18 (ribose-2'-O)-methylase SpoU